MLMVQGQLTPVTLSANESTPKPRICRDMLPLEASQQPRAAAGVCCLHSLMHFYRGGQPLKRPLLLGGSEPPTWFLSSTRVHNLNGISTGSAIFVRLTVVSSRETDRQTDREITLHL